MNYSELSSAIQTYTENNFPAITLADSSTVSSTTQINRFIEQAEQRIYNSVQLANLRKNVLSTLSPSTKYLNPPNDFLSMYSFAIYTTGGDFLYLIDKDVNFIREAYPNPSDTGKPKYYAIFGAQYQNPEGLSLIVGPTPDTAYNVELHYYYYPESIVTAGTTWLGDHFDTVLLYASLVEAYTFMKGEADLIQLYDAKYKEALGLLKNLGDGKQRTDAYRTGQARQAAL